MYETLKKAIVDAMKEKDTLKVQTLRGVKGEIDLDAVTLCEDGRNPEITDTERDSKVKMWKKAVSYSFDWAKQ